MSIQTISNVDSNQTDLLNQAREFWFTQALARSITDSNPDLEQLKDIEQIRSMVRHENNGGSCSLEVAFALEQYFGWPAFQGIRLSKTNEPVGLHTWNILGDGSILDATVDRFGGDARIEIYSPKSDEWKLYRREWNQNYNPDLKKFKELENIQWDGYFDVKQAAMNVRTRGEGWWLDQNDRAKLQAYADGINSIQKQYQQYASDQTMQDDNSLFFTDTKFDDEHTVFKL